MAELSSPDKRATAEIPSIQELLYAKQGPDRLCSCLSSQTPYENANLIKVSAKHFQSVITST